MGKFNLMGVQILKIDEIAKEKRKEYEAYFGDYSINYPYLEKLTNRCDIFIILYLQFCQTKKPLIAVNSHLFYDDAFAHTKLAQCLLINKELNDIATKQWKLDVNKVPIIFGVDANSNHFKSNFDAFYDANKVNFSGVYQLMTTGIVKKEHIDHPYTRCKLVFDAENKMNESEQNEEEFSVNLRGLPFRTRSEEIKQFFCDEKIKNIEIIFNEWGKPKGTAIVDFCDEESLKSAMLKNKTYIGARYVEIMPKYKKPNKPKPQKKAVRMSECKEERFVLKIVGMPWAARENEIREFFKDEKIVNIVVVLMNDGRSSGNALIEFEDDESFKMAYNKNRGYMGHRFLELYATNGNAIDEAEGIIEKEFVRPDIGDWHSPLIWKSAYKEAAGCEPMVTTKTPKYEGVSDYIFISDNCKAVSYLTLPYYDKTFPYLPNEVHPSDHIPIVCDIQTP